MVFRYCNVLPFDEEAFVGLRLDLSMSYTVSLQSLSYLYRDTYQNAWLPIHCNTHNV